MAAPDARGAAMAGTRLALAGDSAALFGGPAGLCDLPGSELLAAHAEWIGGDDLDGAGAAFPLGVSGTSVAGISLQRLVHAGRGRDRLGRDTGPLAAEGSVWTAGLAHRRGAVASGLLIRSLQASAAGERAAAVAADVSLRLAEKGSASALALGAENLGPPLAWAAASTALPLRLRAAAVWEAGPLLFAGETRYEPRAKRGSAAAGIEAATAVGPLRLVGRCGARTGGLGPLSFPAAVSAGGSLEFPVGEDLVLGLDWAWTNLEPLGRIHLFTLRVRQGAIPQAAESARSDVAMNFPSPPGPTVAPSPTPPAARAAIRVHALRLAVEAGTPERRWLLRWTPAATAGEAFHVYAALPEGRIRLTGEPIVANEFVWNETEPRRGLHAAEVEAVSRDEPSRTLSRSVPIAAGPETTGDEVAIRREGAAWVVTLPNVILFDVGRAELKQAAQPVLARVAALLGTFPSGTDVSIVGHTDSVPITGDLVRLYPDNAALSTARAFAVKEDLAAAGVARAAMRAEGRADREPVRPNETEVGRLLNRRVEIVITPIATGREQ